MSVLRFVAANYSLLAARFLSSLGRAFIAALVTLLFFPAGVASRIGLALTGALHASALTGRFTSL